MLITDGKRVAKRMAHMNIAVEIHSSVRDSGAKEIFNGRPNLFLVSSEDKLCGSTVQYDRNSSLMITQQSDIQLIDS